MESISESGVLYDSGCIGDYRQKSCQNLRRGSRPRGRGRGMNPVGADGRITVCHGCGSTKHWVRACPGTKRNYYTNNAVLDDEEVQITLMSTEIEFDDKVNTLFGKTIGSTILDSGCSNTV